MGKELKGGGRREQTKEEIGRKEREERKGGKEGKARVWEGN